MYAPTASGCLGVTECRGWAWSELDDLPEESMETLTFRASWLGIRCVITSTLPEVEKQEETHRVGPGYSNASQELAVPDSDVVSCDSTRRSFVSVLVQTELGDSIKEKRHGVHVHVPVPSLTGFVTTALGSLQGAPGGSR